MATLQLSYPMVTSSRLLPGCRVGSVELSLEHTGRYDRDGKAIWRWFVDGPGIEASGSDLYGHGSHRAMLASLVSFLSACGEAIAYEERTSRKSDNSDLFPADVGQWCRNNLDELSILACELEEGGIS